MKKKIRRSIWKSLFGLGSEVVFNASSPGRIRGRVEFKIYNKNNLILMLFVYTLAYWNTYTEPMAKFFQTLLLIDDYPPNTNV